MAYVSFIVCIVILVIIISVLLFKISQLSQQLSFNNRITQEIDNAREMCEERHLSTTPDAPIINYAPSNTKIQTMK